MPRRPESIRKTSTNSLPTTSNWHHLFQNIKKVIFSYQEKGDVRYQGEAIMLLCMLTEYQAYGIPNQTLSYSRHKIILFVTNLLENHPQWVVCFPSDLMENEQDKDKTIVCCVLVYNCAIGVPCMLFSYQEIIRSYVVYEQDTELLQLWYRVQESLI